VSNRCFKVKYLRDHIVLSRRRALQAGIGATLSSILSPFAHAAILPSARLLSFENLHTGERLHATYWSDGRYDQAACRRLDWVLRDHRAAVVAPISTDLLDLLHAIRARLGTDAPFQVISGYRSPSTNARLSNPGSGVAANSLHVKGMAIDIRIAGCKLADLRETAIALKAGGVGYYPKSNFVHVDVGRVRYW
jgi:uncharacterized protein YcbK (DUF882 family)